MQIIVKLPSKGLIDEVFAALETVQSHERSENAGHPKENDAAEIRSLPSVTPSVQESLPESPGARVPYAQTGSRSPIIRLSWNAITSEEFERVLFNIVADAKGYANPQWLMHTNAPDRGRDISAERMSNDALSGTSRQRLIIQAKHWLSKSVRPHDVSEAITEIALWEPPRVHVLVVATSGRFTADAVSWIEKHNDTGGKPAIEMWAESHIEMLLAHRPYLIDGFNLRQV